MNGLYYHACPGPPCTCHAPMNIRWVTTPQPTPTVTSAATTAYGSDERRVREAALCTCGLVAVGYRHGWDVQHVDACPAAALFEED